MRDALISAAAVFEPEEAAVLAVALRRAMAKIDLGDPQNRDVEAEIARLVHNLGRSRIRLRKSMRSDADATEIAEEAVELFAYLEDAPDAVLAAARETGGMSKPAERIVGTFPITFREPPRTRL